MQVTRSNIVFWEKIEFKFDTKLKFDQHINEKINTAYIIF